MSGAVTTITRKCEACAQEFEVPTGSLIRVCRNGECVRRRRSRKDEIGAQAKAERDRWADLRNDDRLRIMWPEVEAVLHRAAQLGPPVREDLVSAVGFVARAKGVGGLREALLHTSALCLRWAGMLPRGNVLNPTHDSAAKNGRKPA